MSLYHSDGRKTIHGLILFILATRTYTCRHYSTPASAMSLRGVTCSNARRAALFLKALLIIQEVALVSSIMNGKKNPKVPRSDKL